MTFEERIERLTKRQEALDRQMARICESTAAIVRRNDEQQTQLDDRFAEIMEGIARLLHVAETHPQQ